MFKFNGYFFKPYGLDPELQALDNNLKIFFI